MMANLGIICARLNDAVVYEAAGMLPQNVNYDIKSSFVIPLIEGYDL